MAVVVECGHGKITGEVEHRRLMDWWDADEGTRILDPDLIRTLPFSQRHLWIYNAMRHSIIASLALWVSLLQGNFLFPALQNRSSLKITFVKLLITLSVILHGRHFLVTTWYDAKALESTYHPESNSTFMKPGYSCERNWSSSVSWAGGQVRKGLSQAVSTVLYQHVLLLFSTCGKRKSERWPFTWHHKSLIYRQPPNI